MKIPCLPDFSEYDFEKWGELIDKTNLTDIEKEATSSRVISVVNRLRSRLTWLTVSYNILRTTTTVGSVLVPSLLAFQNTDSLEVTTMAMWGVGLAVTLSNAFISLFRVDKNYYAIGTLLEKIESEAWMFLTQCGFYEQTPVDGILGEGHRGNFQQFMERCELLINKAVRTEYTPASAQAHRGGMSSSASVSSVLPPKPPPVNEREHSRLPLREATIRESRMYEEHSQVDSHIDSHIDDLDMEHEPEQEQVETSPEVVDVSVDEHPHTRNSNHRHRGAIQPPHSPHPGGVHAGGISGSDSTSIDEPPLKVVVRQGP